MKIGRHIEIRHAWLLWLPWLLLAVGWSMNAIVMVANYNMMPVYMAGGYCKSLEVLDGVHICMTSTAHLKFLADWISLQNGIASPGDFLIGAWEIIWIPCLGAWFMGQCLTRRE